MSNVPDISQERQAQIRRATMASAPRQIIVPRARPVIPAHAATSLRLASRFVGSLAAEPQAGSDLEGMASLAVSKGQ